MSKRKQELSEIEIVAGDLLANFRVLLAYQQLAIAEKDGSLDGETISGIKKVIDPIAISVANRIQGHYNKLPSSYK